MLGTGRSFRTWRPGLVIKHDENFLSIHGRLKTDQGFMADLVAKRTLQGALVATIDGKNIQAVSELAIWLPFQLIAPTSSSLLVLGPTARRSFLDAGLFYLEVDFPRLWNKYRRYLKQRNAALRRSIRLTDLSSWEEGMAWVGEQVSQRRERYAAKLLPVLQEYGRLLLGNRLVQIQVMRGWSKKATLLETLHKNRAPDGLAGYTKYGPHRFDLNILINNNKAKDILSGGQMKLLACALKLAQASVLYEATGRHNIFLIDDLMSELDSEHFQLILSILSRLHSQCIFTALNQKSADVIASTISLLQGSPTPKMFHMEHGRLVSLSEAVVAR